MNTGITDERKKKLITLGILGGITAVLFFLLFSFLWWKHDALPAAGNADDKNFPLVQQHKRLQQYDELLHAKLNDLERSDKEFAVSITASGNSKSPIALNGIIRQQEQDFSRLVDSFRLEVFKFTDADIKNNFSKMIASFRLVADSREASSSLRYAVAMNKDGFSTDERAMLKMQIELDEKAGKIRLLESELKNAESKNNIPAKYAAGNGNAKALANKIAVLENKITSLSTTNNSVKQENERLQKQQNEFGKTNSNTEAMLKERAIALQQKVEVLNAELQLFKVDCNLSRVDATQIIYTAKQRKQLLTEASSILTDLSATANTDVKRKVKEKIVRLNQVAANSRD